MDLFAGDAESAMVLLWTSGDAEVAEHMAFMYAENALKKGWWKHVSFIIWGPSAKLMAENEHLQSLLPNLLEAGVVTAACKACADRYGVGEKLETLGIDVIYMGDPLTKLLKSGRKILSV
jgi:hypothetical protein